MQQHATDKVIAIITSLMFAPINSSKFATKLVTVRVYSITFAVKVSDISFYFINGKVAYACRCYNTFTQTS